MKGLNTVKRVGVPGGALQVVAPGRVNLLGEHTDYTGGLVLPMAIPFYTKARITPNAKKLYRFRSELYDGERVAEPADRSIAEKAWSDYPVGVLRQLQELGIEPPPFVLELSGNVPCGAGLSSSASVEVASCLAMLAISGKTLPGADIALLCQRAENGYVGSPCGIMDQFVIAQARAGHALMLNTHDLSFELIPMTGGALRDTCVVVCNSMVKHSIVASGYGDRRRELEAGQQVLCEMFAGVLRLGDATMAQLEKCREKMPQAWYKRCRHVVSENARVRQAKDAMLAGDPGRLGELMIQGHASQREDFECSCDEVDFIAATAAKLPGCFGARLTGGGFGGCTVNLVERQMAEEFAATLKMKYLREFGITGETYVCEAVDGAMAWNAIARARE